MERPRLSSCHKPTHGLLKLTVCFIRDRDYVEHQLLPVQFVPVHVQEAKGGDFEDLRLLDKHRGRLALREA